MRNENILALVLIGLAAVMFLAAGILLLRWPLMP